MEKFGPYMAMEGSSQTLNSHRGISQHYNGGAAACQRKTSDAHAPNAFVCEWMYINEHGQICGPYTQESMYDALCTGLLPGDLPIYPSVNGWFTNPIALKYISQFPTHVNQAAHLPAIMLPCASNRTGLLAIQSHDQGGTAASAGQVGQQIPASYDACITGAPMPNVETAICTSTGLPRIGPGEESCWMFEDEEGRKHGPHSLAELSYWHQSGYLHDSFMVYHVDKEFGPCTLMSLIKNWSRGKAYDFNAAKSEDKTLDSFISGISEDISFQLHSAIMRSAWPAFFDEIICTITPHFVASKKALQHPELESYLRYKRPTIAEGMKSSVMQNASAGVSLSMADQMNTVFHGPMVDSRGRRSKRKQSSCHPVAGDNVAFVKKDASCMEKTWDMLHNAVIHANVSLKPSSMEDMDFPSGRGPQIRNCDTLVQSSFNQRAGSRVVEIDLNRSPPRDENPVSPDIQEMYGGAEKLLYVSAKAPLLEYFEDTIKREMTEPSISEAEVNLKSVGGEMSCQPASQQVLTNLDSSFDVSTGGKLEHSGETSILHVFGRFEPPEADVEGNQDIDGPPGIDKHLVPLKVLHKAKFRPSNSHEFIPGTSATNVSMAVCPQNLHAYVPKFRGCPLPSDVVSQSFQSQFSSGNTDISGVSIGRQNLNNLFQQRHFTVGERKVSGSSDPTRRPGETSRHYNGAGSLGTTLVNEKYTHFCGKKLQKGVLKSISDISFSEVVPHLVELQTPSVSKNGNPMIHQSQPANVPNVLPDSQRTAKKKALHILGRNDHAKQNNVCSSPPLCGPNNKKEAISSNVVASSDVSRNAITKDVSIAEKDKLEVGSSVFKQDYSTIEKASEYDACNHINNILRTKQLTQLKRKIRMGLTLSPPTKVVKVLDKTLHKKTRGKEVKKRRNRPSKLTVADCCPKSDGCARTSINGWEWYRWSQKASPSEKACVGGIRLHFPSFRSQVWASRSANGPSARARRVKLRNLSATVEGSEFLKVPQLMARKKQLRLQRSTIHGWGLVALEPIEAGDFVIEYIGELIRSQVSDMRERLYEKTGLRGNYLFKLNNGYVVDATVRGSIARFINHSCEPNCCTRVVTIDGNKRIFIYAKKRISPGEEITYDYKYPQEENKITCSCGSRRCRGSMN